MRRLHPDVRPLRARADARLAVAVVALLLVAAAAPAAAQAGAKVTAQEYEGWRQYNANCARCHGQDALPNPVAANLLTSLAPDGPMHDRKAFTGVVMAGRVEKGMPAFAQQLDSAQVGAIYGYLVGRGANRIPQGRPERPS